MAAPAGYIELTIVFAKDGKQWTATCVESGTATHADTLEQAQVEICELVGLHLNALEDAGARTAFFKKHRIPFHRLKPKQTTRRVPVRLGEYVVRVAEPVPALMAT